MCNQKLFTIAIAAISLQNVTLLTWTLIRALEIDAALLTATSIAAETLVNIWTRYNTDNNIYHMHNKKISFTIALQSIISKIKSLLTETLKWSHGVVADMFTATFIGFTLIDI